MIFLKLLLSSGLTFLAATAYLTPSQKNEQEKQNKLNNMYNITVHHYNITIAPRIEQNIFYGKSNVSIQLSAPTNKIILYSEVECISEVWLSDSPPQYRNILGNNEEMIVYKPIISYNPGMEFIELIFANELSPGNYSLNMKFYSNIANDTNLTTFYKREDKWWLVPTHFHILGARRLFPCLGEFISTTYHVTIQHYRYNKALSNMLKISHDDENDEEMRFTHFQTTSVLPTYLLTGIVTDFNFNIEKTGNFFWFRKFSESRLKFAHQVIDDVSLFLENEWKIITLSHTRHHFAIPHFQDNDIVNFNFIFYREGDIMYDKILDSVMRKNEIAQVIGYKIIKEFILHDVHWSSPFWFVDGLLRFYGTAIANKVAPASRIIELFVVQYQQYFLEIDTSYYTNFKWSSKISHVKVIIMLRMFHYLLSDEIFWNSVHTLINSKVLNEHNLSHYMGNLYKSKSSFKMTKEGLIRTMNKMSIWINQTTYPTVKVTHESEPNKTIVRFTLENYNTSGDSVLHVPVNYATESEFNFSDPYFIDEHDTVEITLEYEDGWVIVNERQIGYYRVHYGNYNWIKISDYLNLPDQSFKKIHVLNRAQIIDDAFHYMITNQLDSFIFWKIARYLSNEIDYVAWYPMFKGLEYISSVFPLELKETKFFEQKVQSILYPLLEKIKYEEVPNEDDFIKLLRQEAAKWACVLDVPKCKEVANRKLEQHLTNPERYKISPWWKEWTYCNSLANLQQTSGPLMAHNSTWWEIYELGLKTFDIKFLACLENPFIIFESINTMENIGEKYGANQVYYFLVAVTRHGRKIDILKNILKKLDYIEHINSNNMNAVLIVIINSLYSEDQLNMVHKYLEKKVEDLHNSAIASHEENNNNYNVTEKIEIDLNIIKRLIKMKQDIDLIKTKLNIRRKEIELLESLFRRILTIV